MFAQKHFWKPSPELAAAVFCEQPDGLPVLCCLRFFEAAQRLQGILAWGAIARETEPKQRQLLTKDVLEFLLLALTAPG